MNLVASCLRYIVTCDFFKEGYYCPILETGMREKTVFSTIFFKKTAETDH